jgi:hypothetical protein
MPSRFEPEMDTVSLRGVAPLTVHWGNLILTIKPAHYRMFCSHCKLRTLQWSQSILSFLHSHDGPYPLHCSVTLYFARTCRVILQVLGKSAASAPKKIGSPNITRAAKLPLKHFIYSTIYFIMCIHPLGYGTDQFGKRTWTDDLVTKRCQPDVKGLSILLIIGIWGFTKGRRTLDCSILRK